MRALVQVPRDPPRLQVHVQFFINKYSNVRVHDLRLFVIFSGDKNNCCRMRQITPSIITSRGPVYTYPFSF